MRQPLIVAALVTAAIFTTAAVKQNDIASAVAASTRSPANVARDKYRHPA